MTQLKYIGSDPGFCRVNYKAPNGVHYCLQDDGYGGVPNVKLYACSQDGEPSHQVKRKFFDIPESPGTLDIDVAVNNYLRGAA